MTEQQLERLYRLLAEMQVQGRTDDAAALRAAIMIVETATR